MASKPNTQDNVARFSGFGRYARSMRYATKRRTRMSCRFRRGSHQTQYLPQIGLAHIIPLRIPVPPNNKPNSAETAPKRSHFGMPVTRYMMQARPSRNADR